MAEVSRKDIEALVLALDTKVRAGSLSWKTATNVWAVITKMFKDSVRSKVPGLRVREDNPCSDVEGPDRGGQRSKAFLFPTELLKFAEADVVPLEWRRLVAIAVYLGARASELEALEWTDIDLEHGKVNIHQAISRDSRDVTKSTKSDAPRTFSMEPELMPLLRAMHAEAGGRGRVVREMPRHRDLAEGFRDWLRKAGVDRPELFISDRTRLNIRFHDLRATSVTWQTVRGDHPAIIMSRVGHEDFETLKKYLRQAEVLRPGFGECFPALPPCLLGPGNVPTNRLERAKPSKLLRGGRDSNPRPPA
ncbi:MAG: site-specific integrase [Myxococcales bacterium]|nr:site-specific integrase [Myxococcales bacterium]